MNAHTEQNLRPTLIDYFEGGLKGKLEPLAMLLKSSIVTLSELKCWLLKYTPENVQGAIDVDDASDEDADFAHLQQGMLQLHEGLPMTKFIQDFLNPLLVEQD